MVDGDDVEEIRGRKSRRENDDDDLNALPVDNLNVMLFRLFASAWTKVTKVIAS